MSQTKKQHINLMALFSMAVFALLISAGLTACQKESAASPTGLNTQLNIINLSPDVLPLLLYVDDITNRKRINYSTPTGYTYLTSLTSHLQLRGERSNLTIIDTTPELRANTRYTLLVTGLVSEKTRSYLFLTDSGALPAVGRGKVRFVNALARSAALDVTANGTMAFKAQATNKVSSYIEMPVGIYNLKVHAAGSTAVLYDLPNVTIQDGRLYTLYTQGIINRTDSARVTAAVINNR